MSPQFRKPRAADGKTQYHHGATRSMGGGLTSFQQQLASRENYSNVGTLKGSHVLKPNALLNAFEDRSREGNFFVGLSWTNLERFRR